MKKRILVVDDEAQIALVVALALRGAGFEIIGPASTVTQAFELLADQMCDAAVLDIKLKNETSEAIAVELISRGLPIIVITGHAVEQTPIFFQSMEIFTKPFRLSDLVNAIRKRLAVE